MSNDGGNANVGQLVILPSSFTGGPRYMAERTQDAMTYVRTHGRPDLFITLTCNSQWPEIVKELLPGQTAQDRHDLIARVFKKKVTLLIDLITKAKLFGPVAAYMNTIEWQKRGLPHTHCLFWLREKLRPAQIDDVISAELPDPEEDPELYDIIKRHMIHGPCGALNPKAACMKDGRCTKRFPRDLLKETQTDRDGYPLYRRRAPGDGGFEAKIKVTHIPEPVTVDNRWVVPYSPLLSKIFNCHVNVEFCNSVKAIKYICKYIYKGSDQAVISIERNDINEVQKYEHGRYISSNEAVWRILNFPISGRHPAVVQLAVHLENGQRVYFNEKNVQQRLDAPPKTTLVAFFELCQTDDFARTLLYVDVPRYYTWNATQRSFQRRKQGYKMPDHPGIFKSETLGRVYTVHPNNFECFCLRLLLHQIRGPKSFNELRTVDGTVRQTYREACNMMGLLEDDNHWNLTLEEATVSQSPSALRNLFAIMITACEVSDPLSLWETHKEALTEDIKKGFSDKKA